MTAADVVDHDLALVPELRRDARGDLLQALQTLRLQWRALPVFLFLIFLLYYHTTLCEESNDFFRIFFWFHKFLFDILCLCVMIREAKKEEPCLYV